MSDKCDYCDLVAAQRVQRESQFFRFKQNYNLSEIEAHAIVANKGTRRRYAWSGDNDLYLVAYGVWGELWFKIISEGVYQLDHRWAVNDDIHDKVVKYLDERRAINERFSGNHHSPNAK